MEYLEQIGTSLGIAKAPKESSSSFYRRIAYSAIADWMQTSAFVGGDVTSIVQLKSLTVEKARMIQALSPTVLPYDADELVEHIYEILIDNGVFLHRNYYIRPAPHRLIGNNTHALIRGMCPEEHASFSGLAPYTLQRTTPCNVYKAFGLTDICPETITEQVWKHGIPVSTNTYISEYLNTARKDKQPYYRSTPVDHKGLMYGRSRRNDSRYDYYLVSDNQIRRISEDHTSIFWHEYGRLHIMTTKQVQSVLASFDGAGLVHVSFSFHLPKPDLRFLQFLAWPYNDTAFDDIWNFSLHTDLWPIVKERVEFLGYKVVEHHD